MGTSAVSAGGSWEGRPGGGRWKWLADRFYSATAVNRRVWAASRATGGGAVTGQGRDSAAADGAFG